MYNFEEEDFFICKPSEEKRNDSNKNFEIYARVTEVDREKDVLRLDKYVKKGRVYFGNINHGLKEMEANGYYQPMDDIEISDFYNGVAEYLRNSKNDNRKKLNDVQQTFEALDAAMNDMNREIV